MPPTAKRAASSGSLPMAPSTAGCASPTHTLVLVQGRAHAIGLNQIKICFSVL